MASISYKPKRINIIEDFVRNWTKMDINDPVMMSLQNCKSIGATKSEEVSIGSGYHCSDLPCASTPIILWLNQSGQPMFMWFDGMKESKSLNYDTRPLNRSTRIHMEKFLDLGEPEKEIYFINVRIKIYQERIKSLRQEKTAKKIRS